MTTAVQGGTTTAKREHRPIRSGMVVSDKGNKTITVRYDSLVRHSKYGKYLRRKTVLRAHDENNEAREGDIVEVVACRRLSRTKCWRLARVLKKADAGA